jgi:hypothetical protein
VRDHPLPQLERQRRQAPLRLPRRADRGVDVGEQAAAVAWRRRRLRRPLAGLGFGSRAVAAALALAQLGQHPLDDRVDLRRLHRQPSRALS